MNPHKFGHSSSEWLLNQISEFYTEEQQKILQAMHLVLSNSKEKKF